MGGRQTWTIGSFLFCFIGNGILIAFFLASNSVLGDVANVREGGRGWSFDFDFMAAGLFSWPPSAPAGSY